MIIGVIAVGVAVVGVGGGALLWGGNRARQASVSDALDNFRDRSSARQPMASLEPEAGVYTYAATGTEKLSLFNSAQPWGPTIPMTITGARNDGCYAMRMEFSTNHVQTFDYCATDAALQDVAGRTEQRFSFGALDVDDTNVFKSDPRFDVIRRSAKPSDSWSAASAGKSPTRDTAVRSVGTITYVGPETISVNGSPVAVYHYLDERTLSGDQTGTESDDQWFAQSNGLLVQLRRSVRVNSPSPIGQVTYTEQGSATITSLTPTR